MSLPGGMILPSTVNLGDRHAPSLSPVLGSHSAAVTALTGRLGTLRRESLTPPY